MPATAKRAVLCLWFGAPPYPVLEIKAPARTDAISATCRPMHRIRHCAPTAGADDSSLRRSRTWAAGDTGVLLLALQRGRNKKLGVTRRITHRARLQWQHEREAAATAAEAEGAEI